MESSVRNIIRIIIFPIVAIGIAILWILGSSIGKGLGELIYNLLH